MLKCANIFISRWEQGQPNTNLRHTNWPAVRYFLGDVIVLWLLLFPTWYEMFDTLFLAFEKNTNVAGNWSQFNEKNDTRLRSFKLPLAPAPVNNSTIKAVRNLWGCGRSGCATLYALHMMDSSKLMYSYAGFILMKHWCRERVIAPTKIGQRALFQCSVVVTHMFLLFGRMHASSEYLVVLNSKSVLLAMKDSLAILAKSSRDRKRLGNHTYYHTCIAVSLLFQYVPVHWCVLSPCLVEPWNRIRIGCKQGLYMFIPYRCFEYKNNMLVLSLQARILYFLLAHGHCI